mmetsp:Transcript_76866/g.172474  ORF Transcript_76866/g.172474 Transcript_76866/m.172474 type:complete len:345 (-) Transcript_76866:129-1163(-)
MVLYKEVQARFGQGLEEARQDRDKRLVELDAEAHAAASAAVQASSEARARGAQAAQDVQREAEERVAEVERERLRRAAAHRAALAKVQERVESMRLETDSRIRDIEVEAEVIHSDADADLLRIGQERDAATRAARERCTEAACAADERFRRCEAYEREAVARSKALAQEEQARSKERLADTERNYEAWRVHCNETVALRQADVTARVEELLREARARSERLLENRDRADQHLHLGLQAQRQETTQSVLEAKRTLESTRAITEHTRAQAQQTIIEAADDCHQGASEHRMCICAVAGKLDYAAKSVSLQGRRERPEYVQGLEELAQRLRAGNFSKQPVAPLPNAID